MVGAIVISFHSPRRGARARLVELEHTQGSSAPVHVHRGQASSVREHSDPSKRVGEDERLGNSFRLGVLASRATESGTGAAGLDRAGDSR